MPMKEPLEVWYTAYKHSSQHLNQNLVGLVCHVGPLATIWKFLCLTLSVLGPIISNFSLFGVCFAH